MSVIRGTVVLVVSLVVSASVAFAEKPIDRATKIVNAQIAALPAGSTQSIAATFASDAVVTVLSVGAEVAKSGLDELRTGVIGGSAFLTISKAKLKKLVAGGDEKMVWIAAEVDVTVVSEREDAKPKTPKMTIRITEIATADAGWKVVAAQFAPAWPIQRTKDALSPIPSTTTAGVLARFLASPKDLDAALSKHASVAIFGSDAGEVGYGPAAAKKVIGGWKKLKLEIDGKVREVTTDHFGFVQANVNLIQAGGAPYRMRALLIAQRDPRGWNVVAVHYTAP